jgi:hypothetical protein
MRRHVAVLGLHQNAPILIDENGAERMIAVVCGAARYLERLTQKMLITFQGDEM